LDLKDFWIALHKGILKKLQKTFKSQFQTKISIAIKDKIFSFRKLNQEKGHKRGNENGYRKIKFLFFFGFYFLAFH
jgi:hypothetical protein